MSNDNKKYSRLNLFIRKTIEALLDKGNSFTRIAEEIEVSVSTVSREVKRNRTLTGKNSAQYDVVNRCTHRRECDRTLICSTPSFKCEGKRCSSCKKVSCNAICGKFEMIICENLKKAPFVCNGCPKKHICRLKKYYYIATDAQEKASSTLSESRSGISLSNDEIREFDERVSPLIKQGLSLHHIMANNRDWFTISEKTAYKLVHEGLISAKPIDMPRVVRFRPRKKKSTVKVDKKCRENRSFSDYLEFMEENDCMVLQGDSVEGRKGGKVILTLTWTNIDFQLGFIRDHNDSASVTAIFEHLYETLGEELFHEVFPPVCLLDNGSEFSNPKAIEALGIKVFYCDGASPYQKGTCEVTHEQFRRIVPKGRSLDSLDQDTVNLIFSHTNSLSRKKLNDKTPYDVFSFTYDGFDIEKYFGIRKIPGNEVILKPSLLLTHNEVMEESK